MVISGDGFGRDGGAPASIMGVVVPDRVVTVEGAVTGVGY